MALNALSLAFALLALTSTEATGTGSPARQSNIEAVYDLSVGADGQPATVAVCSTAATELCLNNNRFRVTMTFTASGQQAQTAQAVGLTSDTGYFWFFNSANVETVVKVLNGCGFNQRYWVFAGGLTDVGAVLTVTDTQAAVAKTYTNPLGTAFQPIQDTGAFATCP